MIVKYSIVIPAFDEEPCIDNLIKNLDQIDKNENKNVEIVFVDDGSEDNTLDKINNWNPKFLKLNILHHPINLGYGAAINSGLLQSKGEVAVSMDADGQHDVNDAINLLNILDKDKSAVMIIGVRDKNIVFSLRTQAKYFLTLSQKFFLGVDFKDANSGMKAIKKPVYESIAENMIIPFDMSYSQYIPLILSVIDKRFVIEKLITIKSREKGFSKISPLDFFRALKKIFYISISLFPRRVGLLFGLNLIILSIIYSGVIMYINNKGLPNGGLVFTFIGLLIILYSENRQIIAAGLFNKLKREIIRKIYINAN
ncbi:glycosyltransferase family 2 protein [Alphaproteobacteria bacterium]|nr:glycosyltransferase family 2 protein [Alphaproteobacteria bacterium]